MGRLYTITSSAGAAKRQVAAGISAAKNLTTPPSSDSHTLYALLNHDCGNSAHLEHTLDVLHSRRACLNPHSYSWQERWSCECAGCDAQRLILLIERTVEALGQVRKGGVIGRSLRWKLSEIWRIEGRLRFDWGERWAMPPNELTILAGNDWRWGV